MNFSMESQQLLEIEPSSSIKFEGTFKEVTTKKLTIKNPLDKYVAFKIKTTTPKQYCVRPSIGYVAPQQVKEISIILQPLEYTITEKARHKFMIQSLIISEEDSTNIDLVWKNASPGNIMCTKLLSVLVQTPEPPKESEIMQSQSFASMEMASAIEQLAESPVSGDVVVVDSVESAPLNDRNEKLIDENSKLKEQVATLKKMVFDQTYRLETLQASALNHDKDLLVTQPQQADRPTSNTSGQLALPLIIYQLVAFFLGLIIGKFFL